jgi:hypothetical protein
LQALSARTKVVLNREVSKSAKEGSVFFARFATLRLIPYPLPAELDMHINCYGRGTATRKPLRREEEPQVTASVFYALATRIFLTTDRTDFTDKELAAGGGQKKP